MKYLVFSDESGRWNEGDYYVRSWIRIIPEQYKLLRKEIIFAKHEENIKELKWDNCKTHFESFKSVFNVDCKIFITISKPAHFEKRKYDIIEQLKNINLPTFKNQRLIDKVKERIIYAVKQELFFNYYEKQHIENSMKGLSQDLENGYDLEYQVDKPQYKQWSELARESGINNVETIDKSELEPGIELADVICGCIKDFINSDLKAKEIYNEYVKSKMMDMRSVDFPNPNLIFINDFSEGERKKLDVFRR